MSANFHVSAQSSQVAQSCDRDDENSNGSGDSKHDHRVRTPQPATKSLNSAQPHLPTRSHPQWLQTVRKLLQSLSRGFVVRNKELVDLNITISEVPDTLAGVSSVAVSAFFQTEVYHSEMRCLNAMEFQGSIDRSRSCGAYISALLVDWTEIFAKQAGDQVETLRAHRLHITADSYTRGVLSALTIVPKRDTQQPLISLVQRKHALSKGLTSVELYTLLALAAKKHLAQPSVEDTTTYEVEILSLHSYWVQRIAAKVPSLYLRSIIQGQRELVGRVEIYRSPLLNFFEEDDQRQILQVLYKYHELPPDASAASPAVTQAPRKRKAGVEYAEVIGGKRQKHLF